MLNFNWLNGIPMSIAKFCVLLAFIAPLIFALILPKDYLYQGAADQKKWRNFKYWILLLVAIQVVVYCYF